MPCVAGRSKLIVQTLHNVQFMVYIFCDEPDSLFHSEIIISDDFSNTVKRYFTNKSTIQQTENL